MSFANFTVFPTGEFLVRGSQFVGPPHHQHEEVLTGLYDRNGRFLKQITLKHEIQFKDRGDFATKEDYVNAYRTAQHALTFSQAVSADDGNVYLVRSPKPLSVDVVSANGDIVRTLTLKPPGPSFEAGAVKVAGGKIVVEFFVRVPGDRQHRIGNFTYSLFDADTGERQYDYYWPALPGGFLACYSPNYLTFLKVEGDGLVLVRSSSR
jgi:hypothetical protein